MNNLPALSDKDVIIGEMALLSLALTVGITVLQATTLPLELLFPAHVLYYLLTNSDRNPETHIVRKIVSGWLYVFGDMVLVWILVQEPLPASWRFLLLEYVIIFLAVYLLPLQPLRAELAAPWLRGLVFQMEALYKSNVVMTSIKFAVIAHKGFSTKSISAALVVGICRLCNAVIIHTLERTIFSSVVDSDLLLRYLRTSPLIAGALLWLVYAYFPSSLEASQEVAYTTGNLLANIAFLAWYSNEAVQIVAKSR